MNNSSKKTWAVFFMLISSLCFAIMAALVKMSGEVPTLEKAFFRNFVSLIISTIMIIYNRANPLGKKENRKYLIARGVLGTIGMIAYFYCIDNMLLADSSMLNKMNPFFITIFAVVFLKEKLTSIQIPALVIAFIGAIFIIKPKFDISVIPAFIGFMSAAFAGAAYTVVRFLGNKEKHYTIVFYFSFISTVLPLPFMLMNFKILTFCQLFMLIGAGTFAAIAQFALTISYKYAKASEVSIYNYTNIIFSQVIAFILWKEVPDKFSIIGYILIIASSILVFTHSKNMQEN
ncbi:DMT family transporter [Clostridium rectalis]|uniref:DMT family transporter n=1 Tax=Clostridium rectalis TaxID=2040295 RepID=UPI000F6337E2|nr:DMT family transporter [Clostridium rectalis]